MYPGTHAESRPGGEEAARELVNACLCLVCGAIWQISIDEAYDIADPIPLSQGDHTSIEVSRNMSDADGPIDCYFHKGADDLNLMIVEQLSRTCGPLATDHDAVAVPIIVTPGIEIKAALATWHITSEEQI